MPTFPVYRYRVVTSAGEFNTSTSEEPMQDTGIEKWIQDNQGSINARFNSTSVNVTAIYSLKGDGTQVKIWG